MRIREIKANEPEIEALKIDGSDGSRSCGVSFEGERVILGYLVLDNSIRLRIWASRWRRCKKTEKLPEKNVSEIGDFGELMNN